jgi:hypothetical protein
MLVGLGHGPGVSVLGSRLETDLVGSDDETKSRVWNCQPLWWAGFNLDLRMCAAKASRHLVLSNARFSLLDIAIVTIGRVEDECHLFIPLTASYDCFIPDEANHEPRRLIVYILL